MTVETAYDPDRIRHLDAHITACIATLGSCRSDDPAAADAMRVVRLTRRNLEDHWMPLVREIESSTAMTVWASTRLSEFVHRGSPMWLRVQHGPAAAGAVGPAAQRLIDLLHRRPWLDDIGAMIHAAHVIDQMNQVLADPQACLDVLSDPVALFMLAEWDLLPDDLVQDVVTGGLHDAIAQQPHRLAEGYTVLAGLTGYVNGALDDGIRPGMARGVAISMTGYITTLAPAIRQEGDYPVFVIDEATGIDIELGTYDDVADLFGAVLRDERAQAALGIALGAYATHVVNDLGAELTTRPGLEHVAGVTDLVADAARGEQAELVAAAAAESARRRMVGDAIGFGIGAALTATGAGAATRVVAAGAVALATDVAARVDADELAGEPIPAIVHDVVTYATISMLAERPGVRSGLGVSSISERQWSEVSRRLAHVDAAPDREERTHRLAQLERWIGTGAPALASLLTTVRSSPGMHELTESRATRDPDDD